MWARRLVFCLFPLLLFTTWLQVGDGALRLQAASPTPTYDPLVEPPLPADPTRQALGRNLYWHWCMPCHGDRGQGLTDDFRMIWEPDHQDCWARGCHGGLPRDEGFPIPRLVPALAGEDRLGRFASLKELEVYLASTHPPQSPGILKAEEYDAIAAWLFAMNERPESQGLTWWPWLVLIPPALLAAFLLLRRAAPGNTIKP